ncbi:hypothetical protein CPB86DRAFT_786128 [Serendipita vermifera]|nr:hypothetical protein CPB86DRAFT_786128 [Serendipita vermifera]
MNNPFDRGSVPLTSPSINNPFDTDPTLARNRFPDISQQSSTYGLGSPVGQSTSPNYAQWQQQPSIQPNQFPSLYGQQQQQQPQSPYGQPFQSTPSPYSMQPPQNNYMGGMNQDPYSGTGSPFGAPSFAGGVASGGSYTSSPLASPGPNVAGFQQYGAAPASPLGYGARPGGLGGLSASSSYLQPMGAHQQQQPQPQNINVNPGLSQFDPLSPGNIRQQQQQTQGGFQLSLQQGSTTSDMDPGPLVYHPRSAAQPDVQLVTGFNGQTTLHIPIRPHTYTQNDHPRTVIATHRNELEQWDLYGWRQCLNSLENLRIAWERMRDDVARVTDIGCPPHENAITLKMKKEATEKIDNVTAAYLQMQEVFQSYRQSGDPSSKRRVRECLNLGLKNLPEWP